MKRSAAVIEVSEAERGSEESELEVLSWLTEKFWKKMESVCFMNWDCFVGIRVLQRVQFTHHTLTIFFYFSLFFTLMLIKNWKFDFVTINFSHSTYQKKFKLFIGIAPDLNLSKSTTWYLRWTNISYTINYIRKVELLLIKKKKKKKRLSLSACLAPN